MSNLIQRSSFEADMLPIINEWHGDDYKMLEDIRPELCSIEKSDGSFEVEGVLSGMSTMQRKNETEAFKFDTSRQMYTPRFTHETWALGFKITMEMMQDGKAFKEARRFTKMLAKAEVETANILAALNINNATSTIQENGDGTDFVSTSHPSLVGNQSNVITSNQTLSEAALESLIIQIRKTVDDRGLRINLKPRKLVIPVDLEPTANRILHSDLRVGTTNNDPNYIRTHGLIPEGIFASPYITSTTQYTLLTDLVIGGLVYYDRYSSAIESDNLFDTKNAIFSKVMRQSTGLVNWRALYQAAGA